MRLETPRLILREFQVGDWRATNRYESDPEVVLYQSFDVMSEAESRAYITKAIDEQRSPSRRVFDLAMILKESGELIGRIGLCHTKPEYQEGTIWYVMDRGHWGKGLMTEAVHAMIEAGFKSLGMRRIIAETDPANIGSIRVLQKNGFRREAYHRQSMFLKGRWVDSLVFALLRDEFSSPCADVCAVEGEGAAGGGP